MTWFSFGRSRDNHSLFLGAAFLVIGLLDFFHTLSYPFMPDFITPNSKEKAAFFWNSARLVSAPLFFASAYTYKDTFPKLINKSVLFAAALVLSFAFLVVGLFYPEYLPLSSARTFLVPVTAVIILYSSYLYTRRIRQVELDNIIFLIYGFIIVVFGDIVYFTYDFSGHLLKLAGFYFIFLALYRSSVELPYEKLAISEEKLRLAAEEKYRILFDNAGDAIITVDLEDKITSWNKAAEKLFGWKAEEVLGEKRKKLACLIVPEELREEGDQNISKALAGAVFTGREVVCQRKDGTRINTSLTISPLQDADKKISGFSGIIRDITEHKRADELLRKSEAMLLEAQRVAHVGNWDWKLQTNELYWSDENYSIFGISKEVSPSVEAFLNMVHPGDMEFVKKSMDDALHGKPYDIDMRIIRPDGLERVVHTQAEVVFDDAGKAVRMFGTVQDITERWRAEKALSRMASILENTPDFVATADSNENVLYMNKGARKMLGIGEREDISQSRIPDAHPEWVSALVKNVGIPAAIRDGFWSGETALMSRDGREIPVLQMILAHKAQDGSVEFLSTIMRDITERKIAEEKIKLRAQLLDNATDSIFVHDFEGNFIYVNEAAYKTRGYTKDELLRIKLPDLDAPEYAKLIEPRVKEIMKKGEATFESAHYRKDGSTIPVEVHTRIVEINEKKLIISSARDITERKKAEELRYENERIMLASKAKSDFLATMSHELRTPLNAIMGFSELMKGNVAGELNAKQRHYADNIITSSKHLLALITDILDLSKVEAGKIELNIETISVPETINEILPLIKEKAVKHNVTIKKELDTALEFMDADRLRFKQVLFNLLDNAVKFSKPEGGTVVVAAKKEEDMARISVSDTGIGIKEEDVGKLFNEFEQVSFGISRKYGGTGLGLAISKKLVELHGGKILAESKYGEGSTFTFLLPIAAKGAGDFKNA
jgi:PAS domain S-box-containing protein